MNRAERLFQTLLALFFTCAYVFWGRPIAIICSACGHVQAPVLRVVHCVDPSALTIIGSPVSVVSTQALGNSS